MATTYGTSYFISFETAVAYYRDYGDTRAQVMRKIHNGSIHIGKPVLKSGHRLSVIDDGARYAITETP